VNSLPKTVTRQRRGFDLNPGPSVPESSTLTTRLPAGVKGGNVTSAGWRITLFDRIWHASFRSGEARRKTP